MRFAITRIMSKHVLPLALVLACGPAVVVPEVPEVIETAMQADPLRRVHSRGGQSWTVLVYMAADNNLEEFALLDLEEMMHVGSSDRLHVIAQIDRAEGFTDAGVGGLADFTSTKRVSVEQGNLRELADLGETDTSDKRVLTDFVVWGVQTYPADRYALVLWNHGSGWVGFGFDDSSGAMMPLIDLDSSLGAARRVLGMGPLALIGFDACLMANVETATAIMPHGEFMLASEQLEPGPGWDYRALAVLRDDPSADSVVLSRAIMRAFVAEQPAAEVTLSLTDLFFVPDLLAAIDQFGMALARIDQRQMARSISTVHQQTASFVSDGIDLGELATRLTNIDFDLADALRPVLDALRQAIVGRLSGLAESSTTGLTVYFPLGQVERDYIELPYTRAWAGFLDNYSNAAASLTAPEIERGTLVREADGLLGVELKPSSIGDVTTANLYSGLVVNGEKRYYSRSSGTIHQNRVSAPAALTMLFAASGETTVPVAVSDLSRLESGGRAWFTMYYRSQPAEERKYATVSLRLGRPPTIYVSDEQGYGQVIPAPGSTLEPVHFVFGVDSLHPTVEGSGVQLAAESIMFGLQGIPAEGTPTYRMIALSAYDRGDYAETP